MNVEIEKLHTAIRRYCIDRYKYWTENYDKFNALEKGFSFASGYSDETLYVIPRYHVLNAVLTEVERHRPTDFSTFDEAKAFFILAVREAQNVFTQSAKEEIEKQAIDEERHRLEDYINHLSDNDLYEVEPLFYRHILSKSESDFVREKLKDTWNVKGYYYPLAELTRSDVGGFQDKYFEQEFGFENLQKILGQHGVDKIWELPESQEDNEIELNIFEPFGSETFWCDKSFEWLIYCSHESSITFGGVILDDIKNNWKNWQERIWTSSFFD